MPRRSSNDFNTEPCDVCGKVIRYKADILRHNRLHVLNKAELMYKCTFDGCVYQNLQKSNVNTHILTHTGEKPHSCPDCPFTTADPGSLTRHRKRRHDYIPKKTSSKVMSTGIKRSPRYTPYACERPISASSSSQPLEDVLNFPSFLSGCSSSTDVVASSTCGQDPAYSYPWDKDFASLLGDASLFPTVEPFNAHTLSTTPQQLSPAANTGQLEGDEEVLKTLLMATALTAPLASEDFDTFLAHFSAPPVAACTADLSFNGPQAPYVPLNTTDFMGLQTSGYSSTLNPPQQHFSFLPTNTDPCNWDLLSTFSSPDGSLYTSESSSSSYSSPSPPVFLPSPIQSSALDGGSSYIFPEPLA